MAVKLQEGKKLKTQGIVILAIVFVVFNVLAFALPFRRNGVFWLSYVFTIIAILAQGYIFRIAFQDGKPACSKFYGFPIARIGLIYLGVQAAAGFVCMALAGILPPWLCLVIFVLILAAAAVGTISADMVRDAIEQQDVKLKKDVFAMRRLQSRAAALVGNCPEGALRQSAQKLSEAFRYSDPVTGDATADVEHELSACMDELERAVLEQDLDNAQTILERTSALLIERNRLCKLNKG